MSDFITASDVAHLIGLDSAAAFLAMRHRLERDEAFPTPMPTSRRPLRWRADAVRAWVSEQGQPATTPPRPAGPNVILMAEAARA